MGKKGGGKKGGAAGGKKGGAKKGGGWEPPKVPEEPLVVRKPFNQFLTVQVRGVIWKVMDFTERVPASMPVFDLRAMIAERHGTSVVDFTLYKEEVAPRNMLSDPACKLGDLEFSVSGDDPRLIYYDFEPRVDDCPLLLRPPRDYKVEHLHDAEAAAKAEREAKYASLRQPARPAAQDS